MRWTRRARQGAGGRIQVRGRHQAGRCGRCERAAEVEQDAHRPRVCGEPCRISAAAVAAMIAGTN